MVYQSRKRKYTSRKEKLENSNRFLRIAFYFTLIFVSVFMILRWRVIWDWLKTYTY